MAPRMIITVTEEMHEAFKRKAKERGATMSGLARVILNEWLREQGEDVEWRIQVGGVREEKGGDEDA